MKSVLSALAQIYETLAKAEDVIDNTTPGKDSTHTSSQSRHSRSTNELLWRLEWCNNQGDAIDHAFDMLGIVQLAQKCLSLAKVVFQKPPGWPSYQLRSEEGSLLNDVAVQHCAKAQHELVAIRTETDTKLLLYIYWQKLYRLCDQRLQRSSSRKSLTHILAGLPEIPSLKENSSSVDITIIKPKPMLESWKDELRSIPSRYIRSFCAKLESWPAVFADPKPGHHFADIKVAGPGHVQLGDTHYHQYFADCSLNTNDSAPGSITDSPLLDLDDLVNKAKIWFRDCLDFDEIHSRRTQVAEAHTGTFDWIFHPPLAHSVTMQTFSAWWNSVDQDRNVFWVSGKAGSGKSTLMKHLLALKRNADLPPRSGGSRTNILLSHFFWAPGTSLQKSITGCMRSLLKQIPEEHTELILPTISQDVFCAAMENIKSEAGRKWLEDADLLQQLLSILLINSSQVTSITIFIDALDECAASEEDMTSFVEFLKLLSQSPNIKICLSSRPENLFIEEFEGYDSFRLETLSRPDILRYTYDKLSHSKQFRKLDTYETDPISRVANIVADKSSGVFLWVYLVVRDLLAGARDGDDYRTLLHTLDLMPPELDEYFHRMLQKVKPRHRQISSALLQTMLYYTASPRVRSLPEVNLVDLDAFNGQADFALDQSMHFQSWSQQNILQHKLESAQRFVNSRSMGLLEFVWNDQLPYGAVHFLHRTVAEFLATAQAQIILHQHTDGPFDASLYHVMRLVGRLRRCAMMDGVDLERQQRKPDDEIWLHDLCKEMDHGLLAEPDLLRRTCQTLHKSFAPVAEKLFKYNIGLDACFKRSEYLLEECLNIVVLGRNVLFINTGFSHAIYLENRLANDEWTMLDLAFLSPGGTCKMNEKCVRLLSIFLSSGIDPNIKAPSGGSAWLRFLVCGENAMRDIERHYFGQAMIMMLRSGAALFFSHQEVDCLQAEYGRLLGFPLPVSSTSPNLSAEQSYSVATIICDYPHILPDHRTQISSLLREREEEEYGSVSQQTEDALKQLLEGEAV